MGHLVFKVLFILSLFLLTRSPSLSANRGIATNQLVQTENILNKLAPKLHSGVKSVP